MVVSEDSAFAPKRTCRICFEEVSDDADTANPLIAPCVCKGMLNIQTCVVALSDAERDALEQLRRQLKQKLAAYWSIVRRPRPNARTFGAKAESLLELSRCANAAGPCPRGRRSSAGRLGVGL